MLALKKNICAIIITFNPDNNFFNRLKKIKNQVDFVVIVDNNSKGQVFKELQRSDKKKLVLIRNNSNFGIAKALNQGIEKAGEIGYKWLITFDQDSVVEANLIQSIWDVKLKITGNLFILGCNYWNINKKGTCYHCVKENIEYSERKTVITSGMFFHLDLIQKIGGFNEPYFIDSVDHEFCLRARSQKINIFISCKALMTHSIGQARSQNDKLKKLVFTHSADRVYYMSRNTLVTIRSYFLKEPVWCLCQLIRLTIEFTAILIRENRKEKSLSFLKGVKDAIKKRMGRINDDHA